MPVLLSGPYWVMYHCGLTFDRNPVLAEYLLTLLGVTLPVAFAAGLLYRMGRMFELKRPMRAGLALAVVLGSGWISYATVLSAGAAAAALVVMAAACLFQAGTSGRRGAALAWVALAGFLAALAATYELTALAFLLLLVLVVSAYRWPLWSRLGGVALYGTAAMLPLILYAGLNRPITGDLRPGFLHPELRPEIADLVDASRATGTEDDDDPPTLWRSALHGTGRFLAAFLGPHGVLTHFPILIVGVLGVTMVMHRHWPTTTKMFAAATLASGLAIIAGYTVVNPEWREAMFANRWFVVFLPLTLFWSGAWLRRSHRPLSWVLAAMLLCFSTVIALLGATDPLPRQGYEAYTASAAFHHLIHPPKPLPHSDLLASQD
jgi:MFS family permease